jgi:hypothetical protein
MATLPPAVRKWFQANGRKGGIEGGKARNAALSDERKREIARLGGMARQAKARRARRWERRRLVGLLMVRVQILAEYEALTGEAPEA